MDPKETNQTADLETQESEETAPETPPSSTDDVKVGQNARADWSKNIRSLFDKKTETVPEGEPEIVQESQETQDVQAESKPDKPEFKFQVYGQKRVLEPPEGVEITPDGVSIKAGSKGEQWFRDQLAAAGSFHEMSDEEKKEYSKAIKENTEELRRQRELQEQAKQKTEKEEYDFRSYLFDDQLANYEKKRQIYEESGLDPQIVDLEYQEKARENERLANYLTGQEEKQKQIEQSNATISQQNAIVQELALLHRIDPELFGNPYPDPQSALEGGAKEYYTFVIERLRGMGIEDPSKVKINHQQMVREYKILTGKDTTIKKEQKGSSTPVPKSNGAGFRDYSEVADVVEGIGGNKAIGGTPDDLDESTFYQLPERERRRLIQTNPKARELYAKKNPLNIFGRK